MLGCGFPITEVLLTQELERRLSECVLSYGGLSTELARGRSGLAARPVWKNGAIVVVLTQPNLTQPNLTQPNLTQSNLTQPNLTQPNLTQPNLSGRAGVSE